MLGKSLNFLLELGVDPNYILTKEIVLSNRPISLLDRTISQSNNINVHTPIIYYYTKEIDSNNSLLKLLLSHGANPHINIKKDSKEYPDNDLLSYIISENNPRPTLFKFLVEHGLKPNIKHIERAKSRIKELLNLLKEDEEYLKLDLKQNLNLDKNKQYKIEFLDLGHKEIEDLNAIIKIIQNYLGMKKRDSKADYRELDMTKKYNK